MLSIGLFPEKYCLYADSLSVLSERRSSKYCLVIPNIVKTIVPIIPNIPSVLFPDEKPPIIKPAPALQTAPP